jgi:ATP-dependent DNA helicase DinG
VRTYARAIEEALGDSHPVYVQGRRARERLLVDFRNSHSGILVGTDSFWEGVSVRGDALRMVLIPRLPFRVPTEPVSQARHERLEAAGRDPFRALSLPQAVIKLRQGFGRLIRSKEDRGAVVVLDRRVLGRWYGKAFLFSLPPARRVTGPSRSVITQLERFYGER